MLAYITEIVHKGKVNYRCGRLPYTYNGLNRDIQLMAQSFNCVMGRVSHISVQT